jgi:misacylated tRNA(Ala) deacylase
MTEALYLEDTSRRSFRATVERVDEDGLVLDRTCFYPSGGGQPNDVGWLRSAEREWAVTDVVKRDSVVHRVDEDLPTPGTTVTGHLDWDRRYAHMRYHTAQHLLSAHLLDAFDAETTGNQVYADRAHLDCAYDRFTEADLRAIEDRMNELVADRRPVTWYELDRSEAETRLDPHRTRLDLLPDSISRVRIVEISGPPGTDDPYDRTACAGTHVTDTGELGRVNLTGRETKGRTEERVEFTLS